MEFWIWDFGFSGGRGNVPVGNSATVPWGQRLESPLVLVRCDNQSGHLFGQHWRFYLVFVTWSSQPEPSRTLRLNETEKRQKNHVAFTVFFYDSSPQPEPSRSLQLNERPKKKPKPSKSIHVKEIQNKKWKKREVFFWGGAAIPRQHIQEPCAPMRKNWKPCGVSFLFIDSSPQPKPSRSLQLNERQIKKHTQPKPSRNLPPESDTKNKVKTTWRFKLLFLWVDFQSQNLPDPYTSMRPPKKTWKPCGVLSFLLSWSSRPATSRRLRLDEGHNQREREGAWETEEKER